MTTNAQDAPQDAGDAALPEDFETAIRELEALVETMETAPLTLDQSLRHYQRGIALARLCEGRLPEVERQVKVLQEGQLVDRAGVSSEGGE